MHILKFGGTSVSSEVSLRNMVKILKQYDFNNESVIIVVSALKGVTNDLTKIIEMVSLQNEGYVEVFRTMKRYHLQYVKSLFSKQEQLRLQSLFIPYEEELEYHLDTLFRRQFITKKDKDRILGFGEFFAAQIIKTYLEMNECPCIFLDARKLIVTDYNFGCANVNWALTDKKMNDFFVDNSNNYVVTGYVGATPEGEPTTLGRGGSDYTASIFGTLLNASSVTKWTDVNGIMTADPNNVPHSHSLDRITFSELLSLSKFSPNVLVHPDSINQLSKRNIPLLIRNTFNCDFPGTLVSNNSYSMQKAFSYQTACSIVELKNDWVVSRKFLREMLAQDYLFFRLKSNVCTEKDRSYYVVSDQCLTFFTSYAHQTNGGLPSIKSLDNIEIVHTNLSLVTITNRKMNKRTELKKIRELLSQEGITLLTSRLFSNAICLVFKEVDLGRVLNFLHEELAEYKEVNVF